MLKILLKHYQNLPLVIVSHQKNLEYISELLTKKSARLSQKGYSTFYTKRWKMAYKNASNLIVVRYTERCI